MSRRGIGLAIAWAVARPSLRYQEEFDGFLRCGFLARFQCERCRHEHLLPFSCKSRAICPSCGGRRMAERAAHLVDHVFPIVPVRQWVLTLPHRVRYLLAWDHALCRAVMRLFMTAVLGSLRRRARQTQGVAGARSGAVVIVQRFGAALNTNVHGHALVLDGVFADDGAGALRFRPAPPPADDATLERALTNAAFYERVGRFFADEGVRAVMTPTGNNQRGGITSGMLGADWNYTLGMRAHRREYAMRVPVAIVSIEAFRRMSRLLERKDPVRVTVQVATEFTGDRVDGVNVFGEVPGVDTSRAHEVVMVGAHLDGWHGGTSATDDGAGVVIAMEAMRILRALDIRPRRTIRLALWTGEEQGLLGSYAYVNREIAALPRADAPAQQVLPVMMRRPAGPPVPTPAHARLSAYYNLDQGGGKIRGVRLTGRLALAPIFERWFAPLTDLGVSVVSPRGGCASDCAPFEEAGIPSPLFLQDPLDRPTRTLHTSADTADSLIPDDLRQAAVVVATMLYNTAMHDTLLPRK